MRKKLLLPIGLATLLCIAVVPSSAAMLGDTATIKFNDRGPIFGLVPMPVSTTVVVHDGVDLTFIADKGFPDPPGEEVGTTDQWFFSVDIGTNSFSIGWLALNPDTSSSEHRGAICAGVPCFFVDISFQNTLLAAIDLLSYAPGEFSGPTPGFGLAGVPHLTGPSSLSVGFQRFNSGDRFTFAIPELLPAPPPVPEPETFVLLSGGFFVLGVAVTLIRQQKKGRTTAESDRQVAADCQ